MTRGKKEIIENDLVSSLVLLSCQMVLLRDHLIGPSCGRHTVVFTSSSNTTHSFQVLILDLYYNVSQSSNAASAGTRRRVRSFRCRYIIVGFICPVLNH